jgi:hypothetical protein
MGVVKVMTPWEIYSKMSVYELGGGTKANQIHQSHELGDIVIGSLCSIASWDGVCVFSTELVLVMGVALEEVPRMMVELWLRLGFYQNWYEVLF